jgi:predicted permease
MMCALWQEVRFAWRGFRKRPGFSLVVVLTLALGVGANTAIFSLVHAVLLRPFPFPEPDQLVEIKTVPIKASLYPQGASLQDVEDWRRRSGSFVGIGVYRATDVNLVLKDRALPAQVTQVTPEFFTVLGIPPLLGRTFLPEEDQPGGDVHKVVLSHQTWRSAYGGDPSIVGATIGLAMGSHEVVGVMPEGLIFPGGTDLWIPVQSFYQIREMNRYDPRNRGARSTRSVARLKRGIRIEQAQAGLESIGADLQKEYPKTNGSFLPGIWRLRDAEVGDIKQYLWLLLAAVGLVLLICCANIANLLLARAASRTRELTVRSALGASRWNLGRQLLIESLLLSLAGGVAGVGLAVGAIHVFSSFLSHWLPAWAQLRLDPQVLIFNFAVASGAGLVFGLAPIAQALRVNLSQELREGSRGSTRSGWLRPSLVVAEVSLATVLLICAGLMLQTLQRLRQVDIGLQAERVMTVSLSAFRPGTNEQRVRAVTAYYRQVAQKLRELSGVIAVGGTDNFPYSRSEYARRRMATVEVRGESDVETRQRAALMIVDCTPGYFEAMGIPLLEGRDFRESDTLDAPWVITLSERTARTLFPDRPALGQQVRFASDSGHADPWATVVGIVGNVKYGKREHDDGLELYFPYTQYGLSRTHFAVRTRGLTSGMELMIRQAVATIDPETPVEEIRPMEGLIEDSLWRDRLWGSLVSWFAGLALLLAAIGIYGVVSYSVTQRTQEIGIRMALGAWAAGVAGLVVRESMRLVAVGTALGIGAAAAATQAIRSFLFGIAPMDPVAFSAGSLAPVLVAVLASLVPALRAARVDPLAALRHE